MMHLHWPIKIALGTFSPGGGRGRLLVFAYHRVPAEPDPLLPDEPDAAMFEQQVVQISRLFRIMPLPEASEALAAGKVPARAACITFDDGYRNNHDVAAPILLKHGAPASFFVTRDALRAGIMWNDLVIEAVRSAGPAIDLSPMGVGNDLIDRNGGSVRLVESILAQIKYLPLVERWEAANRLYASATSAPAPRLMMTEEEAVMLSRKGFDVGGHTISHPILAKLDDIVARQEIRDCAVWLRTLLGREPVSFAYPNGRSGRDYSPRHVDMVRDAGFRVAVTTDRACSRRKTDVLQIPRIGLTGMLDFAQVLRILKLYMTA